MMAVLNAESFVRPRHAPGVFESLRQQVVASIGPGVGVAVTNVDGDPLQLWPVEQTVIRHAIPRRQREFSAGRTAAREAMAQVGSPPSAIPVRSDRSPTWPGGVVGSIAHTRRACVAVAGRQEQVHALGIDLEEDVSMDPDLWETICTPEEALVLATLPASERGRWVTRLFCAKEAFYKWQYPQTGRMLEFRDVQVTLSPTRTTFGVQTARQTERPVLVSRREGGCISHQGMVFAWVSGAPA